MLVPNADVGLPNVGAAVAPTALEAGPAPVPHITITPIHPAVSHWAFVLSDSCSKQSTSNSPFAAAVVLPKAKLEGFAPCWVPADPGNAAELELKGFAAGPDALPNAPAILPPNAPVARMNVNH